MGKRLSVKRDDIPTINIKNLRDPQEKQYQLLGVGTAVVVFGIILGPTLAIEKIRNVGIDLAVWILLGLFMMSVTAGGHKRAILKHHPRSKVTGSSHQEVRLLLNQQCRLLDIKTPPELYIIDSNEVAATVRGVGKPYLVISNRTLQVLTPQEFEALLATLLGRVKSKSYKWRSMLGALSEARGLTPLLCLPWYLPKAVMQGYLEVSHHTADRIALLLVRGDYHLIARTLVKQLSYTSSAIDDDQRRQLESFLGKTGMEAKASDVEQQMILGRMLRMIPGLKERIDNLTHAEQDPAFEAELAKMETRMEKFQPAARG